MTASTAALAAGMKPEELEALKGGIMAEIEAKLSKKEDTLWKRGQVELKRLQTDQQQVKECIGQLQGKQDSLLTDNQQLRGALLEVTTRFELVVKEMREVLRALPQQRGAVTVATDGGRTVLQPSPSPSVASTSASEALRDELSPDCSYDVGSGSKPTPSTVARSQQSPGSSKQTADTELRKDSEDMNGATFCTPPRNDAPQDSCLDAVPSASPAVLSLADSLPPASTHTPDASPATVKRLQLAECLNAAPALPQTEAAPAVSPAKQFDFVTVELVKDSGFVTLGIEVNQVDGISLCVESIDEHGLVGRHNTRQPAGSTSRVQVGDRVIEVNGVRQDPSLMLQECKVRQRLSFTIARDSTASPRDVPEEDQPSPAARRLRPEASVFVPASHAAQEMQHSAPPCVLPAVAVVPPGYQSYDAVGLLTLPTGPALGTQFASMLEAAAGVGIHGPPPALPPPPPLGMPVLPASPAYENDEEVKRALFT